MKDWAFFCLERILTTVCRGFVLGVKSLNWVTNLLAITFEFAVILVAFVATWHWIGTLPTFCQSVVLSFLIYSGALSFVCIIALRFWKPEKFFEIFNHPR